MERIIKNAIDKHKKSLAFVESNIETVQEIASLFISSLKSGGKIIFIGNGGSASDAQHLAAELIGRFKKNRKALPSIALTTNSSILTALGNDYGFNEIFSKQLEGLGSKNDLLVGISTSGESENIIIAVQKAKEMGIKTVGFLGKEGGRLKGLVDIPLIIGATETARIQEIHILVGHVLCEIVEEEFFGKA